MFQENTLIGNLGKDPERRYTSRGGVPFTVFSIATNRKYENPLGETVEETAWWRILTWGKLGENCLQYLKKGRLVLVKGRTICDPKTGGPRVYKRADNSYGASNEVNAELVKFLDKAPGNGVIAGSGEMEGPPEGEPLPPPGMDEDMQI